MNWIIFDGAERVDLLPLTFAKPISDLRVGIMTIKEKWESLVGADFSYMTEGYLAEKYGTMVGSDNMVVNSTVLPSKTIMDEINKLKLGQRLVKGQTVLAFRASEEAIVKSRLNDLENVLTEVEFDRIRFPWDIFMLNGAQIRADIELMGMSPSLEVPGPFVRVIGKEIYAHETAQVLDSTLNSDNGPIYLGPNSTVMEGARIKGPFALGEGGVIKMGAKIYGDTTIGPYSKVGGEVNNSVIQGYSNKGHDGFLGNSVIGEWCNLGADTNNSNLKNNYGDVSAWSYRTGDFQQTGLQFCGLIMGDHSKTGINTMFNTGTTVGYCANIFGADFPSKFVPSFSWGGGAANSTFKIEKAREVAGRMMSRRSVEFTDIDMKIMTHVFNMTMQYRK